MAQNTQDHTDDAIAVALSDPDAGAPPAYANAEPLSGMPKPPRRSGIAWAGIVAALIWVGGAVGYLIGYAGIDLSTNILATQTPVQLAGMAVFAIAPALLFVFCGFMGRELARAVDRTRGIDAAIHRLSIPADAAHGEVRTLAHAVTGEVDRINSALESALARLAAMEEVIAHHADTLERSAGDARDRAETLLAGLREEREKLGQVSESLDDKAALIANAIADQSGMVVAATELAEQHAEDGEKRLRAGADRLAEAGMAVIEGSERAVASMATQGERMHELTHTMRERSDALDAAYLRHRDRLQDASEVLRKEQEKIAAALDFHRAELEVMSTTARDGAESLNAAAHEGADAFKDTVDAALGRAREMSSVLRAETDEASTSHHRALETLKSAAEQARKASLDAAEAFEDQTRLVAEQVESLNEKAFDTAQRADENFKSRLADAEKLTATAANAADDASEAVRKRLQGVVEAAKAESRAVEREIEALTAKLAELPETAHARARETADALRRGLEGLNAAAMTAADEAQEIDAAFQSRIRQNYELLSDFMLHMGSVAGGRRPLDLGSNEVPDPLSRRAKDDAKPASRDASLPEATETEAETPSDARRESVAFPERGRAVDPGWRWKDLLATMNPDDDTAQSPRTAPSDSDRQDADAQSERD